MKTLGVLRWTARVWGVASSLLLLAFAWRRELAGGLVTVGSLALFYLWLFARDGRLAAGPYFILFAAPGFLHVASALLAARRR